MSNTHLGAGQRRILMVVVGTTIAVLITACGGNLLGTHSVPVAVEEISPREASASQQKRDAVMAKGESQIGQDVDKECKPWADDLWNHTGGVDLPPTAGNNFEFRGWEGTSRQVAQWRATYANYRSSGAVGSNGSWSKPCFIPNGDLQIIALYKTSGSGSVTAVVSGSTGTVTSNTSAGKLSNTFTAPGNRTVTVTGASGSQFIVVVLSFSRIQSDWRSGRRSDVIQLAYGGGSIGNNPHTAIVRTDYNEGTDNWLDSNWSQNQDCIVRKHPAGLGPSNSTSSDQNWILKLVKYSTSGFTIYRP